MYIHIIFVGSLGTSVFDMKAVLVGASGGVYALLAAHVANILLVSIVERKLLLPLFEVFSLTNPAGNKGYPFETSRQVLANGPQAILHGASLIQSHVNYSEK